MGEWDVVGTTPIDEWGVKSETDKSTGAIPTFEEKFPRKTTKGIFGVEVPQTPYTRPYGKEVTRGLLEYGGMAGGATIGMPAALPTLGVAPVVSAGAGYATGKKIADILEGQGLSGAVDTTKDIVSGMEQYMVGEFLGPASSMAAGVLGKIPIVKKTGEILKKGGEWVKSKLPALTEEAVTKKAAAKLSETISTPEGIAAATKEAEKVSAASGVKFRRGQIMNDQQALALERDLMTDTGSTMSKAEMIRRTEAQKALENYYQKNVISGKEDIGEVQKVSKDIQDRLSSAAMGHQKVIEAEKIRLAGGEEPKVSGRTIYETAKTSLQDKQKAVTELYNAVPDVKDIDTTPVKSAIDQLKAEHGGTADPSNYPWNIINTIEKGITPEVPIPSGILGPSGKPIIAEAVETPKTVNLKTLIDYDKWTNRLIRDNSENRPLLRSLYILKDSINKAMDSGEGQLSEIGVKAYRLARTEAKDLADTYYKGAIGDVLAKGKASEGLRHEMSDMASVIFKPDTAKGVSEAAASFNKIAGGGEEAVDAVRDYAKYKFLQHVGDKPLTPERVNSFMAKYKNAIKEYGIGNEFSTIGKAAKSLEDAKQMQDLFEKTALSTVIGKDTNKAMQAIYSGKNLQESAKITRETIAQLKATNNVAAIAGYKNAFAEHLKHEVERNLESLTGQNKTYLNAVQEMYAKYGPAIEELYKDEPRKIIAMRNIQKAMEISSRSVDPLNASSQTPEKLMGWFKNVLGYVPGTKHLGPIMRALDKLSQEEVNNVITRASFDPEYADTLMQSLKGQITPKHLEFKLDHFKARMAVYGMWGQVPFVTQPSQGKPSTGFTWSPEEGIKPK